MQNGPSVATIGTGAPIGVKTASQTVGKRGPLLLQDINYLDEMAHFDRERIPERVVHAKGAGAFGYFEVTHDITKYCAAKVFEKVGKRTVNIIDNLRVDLKIKIEVDLRIKFFLFYF